MSQYTSVIDTESDGPHSPAPSSSFSSMNDSSLPTDKMEQLIRKLRSENKSLQLRVLGVNELARLLQDRNEVVKVLQDKNKRLEVAVVRLENRCANLEQKLKADGGTAGPKSMQPPSIPGPSRQILEALMKENSELKKALNNMQRKGASGYLEAVKTTQLEEVIDHQKQELDFLRGQINMLTTTPLPSGTLQPEEDKSQSGDSALGSINQNTLAAATGGAGSPPTLRRQLIKMQHALKVKDRFCSLLSDQVASLQDRLQQMKLDETPPPEDTSLGNSTSGTAQQETPLSEPQASPYVVQDTSIEEHPRIRELKDLLQKQKEALEGRYEHVIEEQKETLQKERQEHMAFVEKLQKSEQDLKRLSREMEDLDKRCGDLKYLNHTLLEDKKQLQESIEQMKAVGSQAAESGGLESELQALQATLQQKVMEHSEELRNKEKEMQQLSMMLEDTEYKYVISHSKLSEIEKEHEQTLTDFQDKLDYKDIEVGGKQTEIEDLKQKNRQLQMDMSSLRSKPSQLPAFTPMPHGEYETAGLTCGPIPPLMVSHNMQYMEAVKDGREAGAHIDPTVKRPTHTQLDRRCDNTNKLDTMNRGPMLLARDPTMDDESPNTSQQQHPSSLPFRTQNPPPHHPSPSPSTATTALHGRRSPNTPYQQQLRPVHQQYPPHTQQHPTPGTPQYLPTPVGYQPQPRQALPPQHYDPVMHPQQHGQYPYIPGQGIRGPSPQAGPSLPLRGVRPKDGGAMGEHTMLPHGYPGDRNPGDHRHGDPSNPPHHHQHHPSRRN